MKINVLRTLLTFLFLLWLVFPSHGQGNQDLANQLVEIGDEILKETYAIDQAREQYLAALDADPNNLRANYMAGAMYLQSVSKDRAVQYLLKAYEINPDYKYNLLYDIGVSYHHGMEFDKAVDYYEKYIDHLNAQPDYEGNDKVELVEVERKIFECGVGKELVSDPERVAIRNLGSKVNSDLGDYGVVLNSDEDFMIFTSRRSEGNLNSDVADDNIPFEDIFYSSFENGEWTQAQNIGIPVGTEFHESNLALSPDGDELYIYRDLNRGDIFVSERDNDGTWSEPQPLPEPINSGYTENGLSISQDGQHLFFSSNRPGGVGGLDIYVAVKDGNRWRHVKNLGETINTPYDEEAPYIWVDGKTLYFSSKGGRGMGEYDIYRTEYDSISDAWGPPRNLGYPINTPDDDVYFYPTKDGYTGYYATIKEDGFGYTDIYEITLIEEKEKIAPEPKPEPVVQEPINLTVRVEDADTGEPIDASVTLKNNETNEVVIGVQSENGLVFQLFNTDYTEYQLGAELNGYAFFNQKMQMPGMNSPEKSLERIIKLKKLEKGYSAVLRNLYFDFDKAVLKDSSFEELNRLEKMLSGNAGMTIAIVGHTDNIGTEEYNIDLSRRRANAVRDYLTSKGLDTRRIKTGGLGAMFPLASNDDEKEGRELNRRVEFSVISK